MIGVSFAVKSVNLAGKATGLVFIAAQIFIAAQSEGEERGSNHF